MELEVNSQTSKLLGSGMASREGPNCHSKRNWKDGIRETAFDSVQRFICRDCGFRFSEKSYKAYHLSENSQLCAKKKAKKLVDPQEIKTCAVQEPRLKTA